MGISIDMGIPVRVVYHLRTTSTLEYVVDLIYKISSVDYCLLTKYFKILHFFRMLDTDKVSGYARIVLSP